jgi:LEA14-like dessication related protein
MIRSLIALSALLTLVSCGSVGQILEGLDKPSAAVAGARIVDLNLDSATLEFDVDVSNPYSFALPVAQLDYGIRSGDQTLLTGETAGSTTIPAGGVQRLPLRAKLPFQQVLGILSGIAPGAVVPYDADLGIRLNVPGGDSLRLPVSKSGSFPVPTVPEVSLSQVGWEKIGLTEAVAKVDLSILNTNQFPIDLSDLAYNLELFGAKVGSAAIQPGTSFGAGDSKSIPLRFSVSPFNVGTGFINALQGSQADYHLSGLMQVASQFGNIDLPYDSSGKATQTR